MVVELTNFGATVIYADTDDNLVNSTEFQLLTDLMSTEIIEPIVPTEG
jgi:hypothetical protein